MPSMKLQVTDRACSFLLKESGINQEANFAWFDDLDEPVFHGDRDSPHYQCAAFTLPEVRVMLPIEQYYLPVGIGILQETGYLGRLLESLLTLKIISPYFCNINKANFYVSQES